MPNLEIRLFGGVLARSADDEPVDLGPAKCRIVLAALALSAGSPVPVERLVELVWGADPPRTADKTLQTYVTRLRKSLGASAITRIGGAYRLEIEPDAVDVNRFTTQLASGNVEGALAEWTDQPLAGLNAQGLSAVVDSLVEQWLGAVEADLGTRVDDDPAAAIPTLTELTAEYPFREGLWALRMTALYRVGRQADALATYRAARTQLVEQLGIEPGPRLRDLEASILAQADHLSTPSMHAGPETSAGDTGPAQGADGHTSPETSAGDTGPAGAVEGHTSPETSAGDTGPAGAVDSSVAPRPRGTVAFGFSDVEGSTRLWAANRRAMAAIMERHDMLLSASAEQYGGHVFATVGDTVGVAFHRASDAAAWATDVQASIGEEPWPDGIEIRLRIGLHVGEAEERGVGYHGPTVGVTERIADTGHGGQTVVSDAVAALLDGWPLARLGTFRLRGVAADHQLFQLGDGEHPPLRTEERGGNLPRRLGRLIGRQDDLQQVEEALSSASVVTLVGPGGIGKTRLALAVARLAESTLSGGAWMIELAGLDSGADVARAVAGTLSINERQGETLISSIVAGLAGRQAILVLDNCEQVIEGAAELADAVASGCPELRVLATSREGLGIAGEQLITVSPLDPADGGAELFNERALAADRSFDVGASRPFVEEICRRLDGVPLAIELAAARVRSLSPRELVERLDDRLRLLAGGSRRGAERHRTLRAAVQWSYDLLSNEEQVLFRRLSVFTGPFDLTAAEDVGAAGALAAVDIDRLLGNLVDRSMIIVDSGPRGRRFRVLETIRQFGAEQLDARAETEAVASRHAHWCRRTVLDTRTLLAGHEEIEGVDRLAELWPNLRAAVHWALACDDHPLAHDLIRPVAAEIYLRSRTEIGDWIEQLLATAPPDDELTVFGVTWATRRYMRTLDRDGFEHLVARFGEPDHPLIRYGRAFVHQDFATMARAAPQAHDRLRREGDRYDADLFELAGLGSTLLMTGQFDEHEAVMTELVDRCRMHGPPTGLNWALTMLGFNAAAQGDNKRAWTFFEESMSVEVPDGTHNLKNPLAARTALRNGDWRKAFRILGTYVDELIENDNLYLVRMIACADFIDVMLRADQVAEAARILGYLETSGRLSAESFTTMITSSAAKVTARSTDEVERSRAEGRELDERQALRYMHDVLDRFRLDDGL